ncbi:hypothetical protein MPSEU_000075400 [Mayamaea pseudoterrestris]|nr:hypothetical protein MPSEU_000075400 [Mayamaea pseudoterrestris]
MRLATNIDIFESLKGLPKVTKFASQQTINQVTMERSNFGFPTANAMASESQLRRFRSFYQSSLPPPTQPHLTAQAFRSTQQWTGSPAQQSPMSPADPFAAQMLARSQRMQMLREGFFAPSQSFASDLPPPLRQQHRQRQHFIQSIPPPPLFTEPSRRVSVSSIPSSDAAYMQSYLRNDPRSTFAVQPQAQAVPNMNNYSLMRRDSTSMISPNLSVAGTNYPVQIPCSYIPSPSHIPTKLHNLQFGGEPKPAVVTPQINPKHYFPAAFYPSSSDVVIEWSFDKEGETRFPGKNRLFGELLLANHGAYLACRSKAQVSSLVDAIIDALLQSHGHFVVPQRVNDKVLWKRADFDMARAFCVHRLQFLAMSQEIEHLSQPTDNPATRQHIETSTARRMHRSNAKQPRRQSIAADMLDDQHTEDDLIQVKFKRPRNDRPSSK